MTSEQIKALDHQSVMQTYGRFDVVIDHGEGATLYSPEGRAYIDFASGIGVASVGYGHPHWLKAVNEQAAKLAHVSNLFYSEPYVRLAAMLTERTGMADVFFANGGGEANEGLIKLARKYSFDKYGEGRATIITLRDSFHGRTITTLKATGQDVFHNYFFPFVEGFVNVEANNIEDLRSKLDDTVCAVMFEYIQGEGGVMALQQEFVDEIYRLCAEKDVLTIADEVQTGVGRTGKFLAGDNFGKKADLTTLAKGLAGGVPIGVCLSGEKCAKVLTAGTHGSTFGGNPISCAGGLAVLETVNKPGFLDEVARKGAYIREKLLTSPEVASVSGMGLMIGIELKNKKAGDVVKAALDKGLLLLTAKTKIRLLPPLTITYEEIDKGLEILLGLLNA